jgi:hypothetical protein
MVAGVMYIYQSEIYKDRKEQYIRKNQTDIANKEGDAAPYNIEIFPK